MLGLDGSNAGGVDPAHLAGADTNGLAVFGVDNGVGLDVFGHFPGKDQIVQFGFGGGAVGDDLEVIGGNHANVAALHQQAAVDAFEIPARGALCRPLAAFEQAHIGLAGDRFTGRSADYRGNYDLDKLALDDGAGGFAVKLAVEGDNAAKGRLAVGGIGAIVGQANAAFILWYHSNATGVGMFDDYAGRLAEVLYAFQCGIGVRYDVE